MRGAGKGKSKFTSDDSVRDARGPGAPASRGPFPQIPAFEDRCIPAGFVALPRRTAVGTPRSGASPVRAHRPSRCTASSRTDPWTPGGVFRGLGGDTPLPHPGDESGVSPADCVERNGSERSQVASVAQRKPPASQGSWTMAPPERVRVPASGRPTDSGGRDKRKDSRSFRASGVDHGRQEHRQSGDDDCCHAEYASVVLPFACHGFPPESSRRFSSN